MRTVERFMRGARLFLQALVILMVLMTGLQAMAFGNAEHQKIRALDAGLREALGSEAYESASTLASVQFQSRLGKKVEKEYAFWQMLMLCSTEQDGWSQVAPKAPDSILGQAVGVDYDELCGSFTALTAESLQQAIPKAWVPAAQSDQALQSFKDFVSYAAIVFVLLVFFPLSRSVVQPAPGYRFQAVTRFCFPKRIYSDVFEQAVSDLRHEYFEALSHGRYWHARWLLVAYPLAFVSTVLEQLPFSLGRLFKRILRSRSN